MGFGSSISTQPSSSAPVTSKKKKQKGKGERASVIRRAPIQKPDFASQQDAVKAEEVKRNESAFLLAWLGLGGIILVEGIVLASSGFLPEQWDNFFVKYLYPSFTPTVGLFVAGTVGYGVLKYLENEKLRNEKYGAGRGSQGGFNHGLDAQPGQRFPVRAKPVVLLGAEPHVPRNVGAGLVRVELGGFPPRGERGRGGVGGGEGDNEVADNPLLSVPPTAVPDGVNGDVGGENGAHVVLEMDEVRGALVLL
nr:protein LOW PSII ACCUMULATION 2, chloroplastic [Ipomoea batatas]GME09335.1 protein LOW PSII ACCUMULATION 2, chloroplastic [Ipomoea batatas]